MQCFPWSATLGRPRFPLPLLKEYYIILNVNLHFLQFLIGLSEGVRAFPEGFVGFPKGFLRFLQGFLRFPVGFLQVSSVFCKVPLAFLEVALGFSKVFEFLQDFRRFSDGFRWFAWVSPIERAGSPNSLCFLTFSYDSTCFHFFVFLFCTVPRNHVL